jgi:hypothetical protein
VSNKNAQGGKWQTTLPLNYGNSGSPVFHTDGNVVAIAVGGRDDLNSVTYVIPINFARALLDIARQAAVSPPQPSPTRIVQKFMFYESADHEEAKNVAKEFCLPNEYVVENKSVSETTKNGDGTHFENVTVTPGRSNCVTVTAFIKGNGVRKVGPFVVDHLGRGWLGLDVSVAAVRKDGGSLPY